MVRWLRWHCPPDTGFEIRALAVWGRARYLSVTEAPHNTDFSHVDGEETLAWKAAVLTTTLEPPPVCEACPVRAIWLGGGGGRVYIKTHRKEGCMGIWVGKRSVPIFLHIQCVFGIDWQIQIDWLSAYLNGIGWRDTLIGQVNYMLINMLNN